MGFIICPNFSICRKLIIHRNDDLYRKVNASKDSENNSGFGVCLSFKTCYYMQYADVSCKKQQISMISVLVLNVGTLCCCCTARRATNKDRRQWFCSWRLDIQKKRKSYIRKKEKQFKHKFETSNDKVYSSLSCVASVIPPPKTINVRKTFLLEHLSGVNQHLWKMHEHSTYVLFLFLSLILCAQRSSSIYIQQMAFCIIFLPTFNSAYNRHCHLTHQQMFIFPHCF